MSGSVSLYNENIGFRPFVETALLSHRIYRLRDTYVMLDPMLTP